MKKNTWACLMLIAGAAPIFAWGEMPVMQPGIYTDTASGAITITSGGRTIEARIGQFTFTPPPTPGGIAQPPQFVPPSQGIQVVLPPNIISNSESGDGIGTGKSNTCTVPGK
jgi:hypothetical protein